MDEQLQHRKMGVGGGGGPGGGILFINKKRENY